MILSSLLPASLTSFLLCSSPVLRYFSLRFPQTDTGSLCFLLCHPPTTIPFPAPPLFSQAFSVCRFVLLPVSRALAGPATPSLSCATRLYSWRFASHGGLFCCCLVDTPCCGSSSTLINFLSPIPHTHMHTHATTSMFLFTIPFVTQFYLLS